MFVLTAVLVETGAMPVPTKLQNPTVCAMSIHQMEHYFKFLILDMGVFIRFMGSTDCNFMKIAMGELYFQST